MPRGSQEPLTHFSLETAACRPLCACYSSGGLRTGLGAASGPTPCGLELPVTLPADQLPRRVGPHGQPSPEQAAGSIGAEASVESEPGVRSSYSVPEPGALAAFETLCVTMFTEAPGGCPPRPRPIIRVRPCLPVLSQPLLLHFPLDCPPLPAGAQCASGRGGAGRGRGACRAARSLCFPACC